MSKFCVNSHAQRALALSLAFAVVFFCCSGSFSSVRADYTDESFKEIMIVILDSWGVNFRKSSSDESPITEYFDELMTDFLEDSEILQDDFFAPFQYGVDQLGNLIANNYLVQGCIDFVNWLTGKYSLQDNDSVNVHPSGTTLYTIDGYPCFLVPTIFSSEGRTPWGASSSSFLPSYFFAVYDSTGKVGLIPFAPTDSSSTVVRYWGLSGLTSSVTLNRHSGIYQYAVNQNGANPYGAYDPLYYAMPDSGYILPYSFLEGLEDFFSSAGDVQVNGPSPPFYIDTRTISVPTVTPADGIQVSVPGTNWGDTISDVLDLVERLLILYDDTQLGVNSIIGILADLIENLQDSVDIQQDFVLLSPDLSETSIPSDSAWGVVSGVFDSFSEGLSLLSFLVFSLPSAFWVLLTATFCFIFIYVFIKMGRDSH